MKFSEALGRKVVSTADASTVGTISSFVIDPAAGKVVALSLAKSTGPGNMLPWSHIAAFGSDAVTVTSVDQVTQADEQLAELDSKPHAILRKRVLTTAGYEVGTIRDVEFDPASGALVSLAFDDRSWDGQALVGVGSYAAVVRS